VLRIHVGLLVECGYGVPSRYLPATMNAPPLTGIPYTMSTHRLLSKVLMSVDVGVPETYCSRYQLWWYSGWPSLLFISAHMLPRFVPEFQVDAISEAAVAWLTGTPWVVASIGK